MSVEDMLAAHRRASETRPLWIGKGAIIPLADVQHIETHNPGGLIIVTKHTRWDMEADTWANNIWIDQSEAQDFLDFWTRYRVDCDKATELLRFARIFATGCSNTIGADFSKCRECAAVFLEAVKRLIGPEGKAS